MLRLVLTLPIVLTACLKDESVSGFVDSSAVYRLEEVDGQVFGAMATLTFPEFGMLQGQAPCNAYSAQQTVPYPWFRAEALVSTKRACPDMATETAFFSGLQAMTLVEVNGSVLILSNDDGAEMVFRAD